MTSAEHVFDRLLEIALLIQEDLASSFAGTGPRPGGPRLRRDGCVA